MPASYPDGDALKTFLSGLGIGFDPDASPYNNLDYDAFATAGRQTFEQTCGRTILATTQTRYFDPPFNAKSRLFLKADLLTLTSLTVGGIAKTRNTDFWLYPLSSEAEQLPFEWIDFVNGFLPPLTASMVRSIAVTGSWGYASSVPYDVYNAILQAAGSAIMPHLISTLSGGVKSYDLDGVVKEEYDISGLYKLVSAWQHAMTTTAKNYERARPY